MATSTIERNEPEDNFNIPAFNTAIMKEKLRNFPRFSLESLNFYKNYVQKNIKGLSDGSILRKHGKVTTQPSRGRFYIFFYDAKTKEKLEAWDSNPLILCFNITENGFYGINFHYIPPSVRMFILNELLEMENFRGSDLKIQASWAKLIALTQSSFIKFACKQYLYSHLQTPLIQIEGKYLEPFMFLPVRSFEKLSSREVWKRSRQTTVPKPKKTKVEKKGSKK